MALTPALIREVRRICGADQVLSDAGERLVYECDAYPLARAVPDLVAFPGSTAVAGRLLAFLSAEDIAITPRGSGTSLAGGCLSAPGSVCVSTARMNRILEVDLSAECAVVEAGVITQDVNTALAGSGYHYAPDPSSQTTCTVGGNVANNAGGPHTLKYGVTAQHVLGLTAVLPGGEILRLGGKARKHHGYDLLSLFVGSEGTLGLITEIVLRLTRTPTSCRTALTVFDRVDDAGDAVGSIMAAGIVPAALEMMDRAIIRLVEDAYGYGLPCDAAAILIIEIDGLEAGLDAQLRRIKEICRRHGARRLEEATTPEARALLWRSRKTAFGALGRTASDCITQDGVVPRSQLAHILRFIEQVARKHDLPVANTFHAGDGNIHPNFLFDRHDPASVQRVMQAGHEILAECVRVGGSITGEHGVGVEKVAALKLMFNPADLAAQRTVRWAFDPRRLANPNKVFE